MPHESSNGVLTQPHEPDGVLEKGVALAAIGLAVVVWIGLVCLWLQFRSTEGARYRGLVRPAIANSQSQPTKAMPAPQLDVAPGEELAQLRAKEDAELNTYGWIDRSNQVLQIPIERAMELIAQRGLPATGAAKSEYELILERSRDRKLAPMKEAK